MITFELQPVLICETDISVEHPSNATHWAVYWRDREGLAHHVEDFESYTEGQAGLQERVRYWLGEVAEQVALFATELDIEHIPQEVRDDMNGMAGIYAYLSDQAQTFCAHHWELKHRNQVEDYWDENDWYLTSDQWFEDHIAERLYFCN